MKVLFIGGTGNISFECVHEAVRQGHEVWVFNRGNNNEGLPKRVKYINGDFSKKEEYSQIAEQDFDVIAQFLIFSPEEMRRDLELLQGKDCQYIFISTTAVYEKFHENIIVTEDTPASNTLWSYGEQKAVCEKLLQAQQELNYTIVRPAHTIRLRFPTPMMEGDLAIERLQKGKPLLIPGDGNSLWTLTSSGDFAVPFVRLFGNEKALNNHFHITHDRAFTWNHICRTIANVLEVDAEFVYVPTQTLLRYNPDWYGPFQGDVFYGAMYDNTKLKSAVGDFECSSDLMALFSSVKEEFYKREADKKENNPVMDELHDRIIRDQNKLGK